LFTLSLIAAFRAVALPQSLRRRVLLSAVLHLAGRRRA